MPMTTATSIALITKDLSMHDGKKVLGKSKRGKGS